MNVRYVTNCKAFEKIPGSPIAYWVARNVPAIFENSQLLETIADVRHGLSTGKNDLFVRLWHEIEWNKADASLTDREELSNSHAKYFPYNKGGEYRKWYGNITHVVWYDSAGQAKMKSLSGHRHDGREMYFHEGITWTFVSTHNFGVRYSPNGFVFDVAGSTMFLSHDMINYVCALLCSKIGSYFMSIQNPTMNFQVGNLRQVPVIVRGKNDVDKLSEENIVLEKQDWDAFETSWEFKKHPLI